MKLKYFIKLFIPPIILKIKNRLINREKIQKPILPEKMIAYNFYVKSLERKRLHFSKIFELSEDFSFAEIKSITTDKDEANFYGDFFILNKYCDSIFPPLPPVKFSIQHGVIFFAENWEQKKSNCTNFVWSKRIAEIFTNELGCKSAFPIGSPFFYAKSLLSENEIKNEKKRLGRNLLAFPMHSTHWVLCKYNPEHFINVLKEQQNNFDTIRICLYWKDIQKGAAEPFRKEGFECVTCGHIFDPYFLQRQKSLFEIADATISNRIGSQAGYSIGMNKPHWIIPDSFDKIDDGNSAVYADSIISGEKEKKFMYITDAFLNNSSFVITQQQKKIVDEFWGISCIKSPEEIKHLIYNCYTDKWT